MDPRILQIASEESGVPQELLARIIRVESNGDPNAKSGVGAQGLMQLMPATSKRFGVENPFDPEQNVRAGAKYMAELLRQYKGNERAALAHYNGGTSQGRLVMEGKDPTKKETFNYLVKLSSPQGSKAPASAPLPTASRSTESGKIGQNIAMALANGVSEEDVVKHMATMPEYQDKIQKSIAAGASVSQILEAAGGNYYTNFIKDKQANDPTAGMSTGQKFLAGAGGRFMDYATGIKQLTGNATAADMDEKRRLDAPLMAHGAAKVGSLATDVATSMLAPAGAATTAGRVALGSVGGAAQSALEGVGTGESRGQNALIGGVAGGAGALAAKPIEKAISYIPTKAKSLITGEWGNVAEQQLAKDAAAMGVSLRPSQQGSKVAGLLEKTQRYTPIAGGILQRAEQEQAEELAGAVNKTLVKFTTPRTAQEGAENVVRESVTKAAEAAKNQVSNQFDAVGNLAKQTGTTAVEMEGLRGSAQAVKADLQDVFDKFGLSKLRQRVAQVLEGTEPSQAGKLVDASGKPLMRKPTITFDEARALRSDIGSAVKAAERASFTGGATEQEVGALKKLFSGLEQDLDKWGQSNQAVKGAWDAARENYKKNYFEVFRQPGNVRKMLKPDFDVDRVVTSSLMPEHGAKAANLMRALDPEGQQAAKQLLVERALSDFATDPNKALRRLDFGKAGKRVFTPDELKELTTLRELISRISKGELPGSKMGASTARMARHLGGAAALGTAIGTASSDDNRLQTLVGAPLAITGLAALANTGAGRRVLMARGKPNLSKGAERALRLGTLGAGQTLAQALKQQAQEENR